MSKQRFTATVVQNGRQVYLPIPFDPDSIWGSKERHHVTGSIDGRPIRGALSMIDDGYSLTLGAAWRRDNQVDAGVTVAVELAPEGPQVMALADDITAALDAEPEARVFFEALATFYRKGYLRWIDGARKPEARTARIAEMIELLKAGQKQRIR